jgi:bifunctional non-homologous end joining protein LigD
MAGDEAPLVKAGIRLTHPSRVLFPGHGLSKADLAAYYEAVAERMLPHISGRPLSLVRCPAGSGKKCFFQKHDTGGFPEAMRHTPIAEATGKIENYFYLNDLSGLIAGVQMGVLEFHVWGVRLDSIEKPDRLVFDLDPDVGLDFASVRRAAIDVRDRLAALGLVSFAMLTGGKGIHVVAPLLRRLAWPDVKAFAKGFAATLAADESDRYVANMAKAKRKGLIFVDYLRNERGATAIAPYSTRARDGAPVAAPIAWEELDAIGSANAFSVRSMAERAASRSDPWDGYFEIRQSIARSMLAKVKAA